MNLQVDLNIQIQKLTQLNNKLSELIIDQYQKEVNLI